MGRDQRVVLSVVGARPQFVKLGPVCRAFEALPRADAVAHRVVHTGQHYDAAMSDVFFEDLALPEPDAHLGVGSGSHGAQTGLMLARLEEAFARERPRLVLVYGDTNSTLAAALTAVKQHIPVAHVEAGLRSFHKNMPEEVNRVLADHVSTLLFCPTPAAVANLKREGIEPDADVMEASVDRPALFEVGDVMKDAVDQHLQRASKRPSVAARLGVGEVYAVATVHRAENTDDPRRLRSIADALADVAKDVPVIVPLHPRTRHALASAAIVPQRHGLHVTDPLSYLDMLQLVSRARLVLTDSGGLQKEAYLLGVPCVTLRDETEWVELVAAGWNHLAAADRATIVALARAAMAGPPPAKGSLYGDGHAGERIAAITAELCRRDSA